MFQRIEELLRQYSYPGFRWTDEQLLAAIYHDVLPRNVSHYQGSHNTNPNNYPLNDNLEEVCKLVAENYSAAFKPADETVVASNGKKKNGKK